jgi:hypothetical protein
MKEIILSNGLIALVDDDDYSRLSNFSWFAMPRRNTNHAARKDNSGWGKYRYRKNIYMHTDVMGITPDNLVLDHIDRNGLNNQKANLRFVTYSQNAVNSERNERGHIERHGRKWRVRVKREGIRIEIGSFYTHESATKALEDFLCE